MKTDGCHPLLRHRYRRLRDGLGGSVTPPDPAWRVCLESPEPYSPLPVSERLAQAIWYDQRVRADRLQTADGRRLRVLSPGQWNLEAGPDFLGAKIQFDGSDTRVGDVEVHLLESDWKAHGHGRDPAYRNVILHVVLWKSGTESDRRPRPVLFLQDVLDSPLEDLYDSLDVESYPYGSEQHRRRCELNFREVPPEQIAEILESAGEERFLAKARKFDRWMRRADPEQALYEGLMESLGYKANKEPFRRIARAVPWAWIGGKPVEQSLAQFLGVAGFLPTADTRRWPRDARDHAKQLWDIWWRYRSELADQLLPRAAWKLSNIRPANHPQRRLAAMALLASRHRTLQAAVRAGLGGLRHPFWSFHCTLGGPRQSKPSDLIGAARAREIHLNVWLPFQFAVANRLGDENGKSEVLASYHRHPPLESNLLLRRAIHQLFGAEQDSKKLLSTACRQQGLHQIFSDFCLHDRDNCRQCLLPKLVVAWGR